jgi:hypothetical protein
MMVTEQPFTAHSWLGQFHLLSFDIFWAYHTSPTHIICYPHSCPHGYRSSCVLALQIGAGSLVPSIMLSVYNADMMNASTRAFKVSLPVCGWLLRLACRAAVLELHLVGVGMNVCDWHNADCTEPCMLQAIGILG